MKMALVTESFFPTIDGVTTTVKAIADRLIESGHEVRFIAPGPGLPVYRNSRVVRVSPIAKTGRQVRSALESFAPDVVVSFDPGPLGRKALSSPTAADATTLVVQQSLVPPKAALTWNTSIAAYADEIFVTSEWLRRLLAAIDVRAEIWEPGVDTAAFSPTLRDDWLHRRWAKAKSRPTPLVVVGYAGNLAKGHRVRRLAELTTVPGIRLVIIGDGPQRGWLKQRIPQAKLTGPLGTGDMAIALASLDVLVHPGEEEGCGHILREAAASAVPVVAPRAGAAAELVHHMETGVLYDPARRRELADAVASVVSDPRRRLLGDRGRELVATRPWSDAVDELLARLVSLDAARSSRSHATETNDAHRAVRLA
ncbi:glycosyltransferase [Nocardioides albus]|uniref:Phosphatidylinositol alpha 1,6-mannosyltransferase n=1 Tax=Nocardioides albus TaxID=1841 RepID=A0A7W5F6P3_9ACTN|nr:glycosyltransferase [Nocardioides albus]MBB3087353.1 phosphatidylinositol alpha 1,6-mannosyltransferase [Nocardioides albus]GGU08383.1 GDP-mannose-dependent alpha-mannosyltransferase [Nocardioides albus]